MLTLAQLATENLREAVLAGDVVAMRAALDDGASPGAKVGGWPLYSVAAICGQEEAARVLLAAGADPTTPADAARLDVAEVQAMAPRSRQRRAGARP